MTCACSGSSKIAAAAFSQRHIEAVHIDSRKCIVTDATFGKAVPQFEETDARLAETVKPLLDRKRVPVMGGFIASTLEGIATTLGRGGSDFSAAIIGVGLNAERIEIWTDVDGMMTTDPNLCPDARRIKTISYGKEKPFCTESNEQCWQQNRRGHFVYSK